MTTARPPEEDRLVARLVEGDDSALKDVICAHGGVVFGMAAAVTRDLGIAEEVAQDTFLALWRQPDRFDPKKGSLRAFLLRIARYKAIDRVRQQEARQHRERGNVLDRTNDREVKEGPAIAEEKDRVHSALSELTPLQREMILLTYFAGRTRTEAAAELGIPEGTAKSRLRDAMIKLRSMRDEI